ncbi:hypothetical protein [Rhizobium sp. CC-YZS058]|uniref:hypothetical protein n=1 Tax=Rhizobium sp. CC-YZS058 TaxID=3042153 RepID=UPI002B05F43C|nr:hypothetical protein [Rhizobium sp. CC-YZS058]MEA3536885.1 hypothetical protein [Rhizobium sp. CC-YZS058]
MDLLASQLSDPFRIGLILFLFLTALRTRAAMGLLTPLALGIVFVAVLLPLTTGASALADNQARWLAIGWGLLSNAIILACILGLWSVWERVRR